MSLNPGDAVAAEAIVTDPVSIDPTAINAVSDTGFVMPSKNPSTSYVATFADRTKTRVSGAVDFLTAAAAMVKKYPEKRLISLIES